jgi:hypothetical protein
MSLDLCTAGTKNRFLSATMINQSKSAPQELKIVFFQQQ